MKVSLFPLLLSGLLAGSMLTAVGQPAPPADRLGPASSFEVLTDFEALAEVFNRDQGHVRLVALFSPSCGYCIKGYRYLRKILSKVPDERLRMYVVWEPMLSGDTRPLAERMSRKAKDPRMAYQAWDPERISGAAWQKTLGLGGIAWDVYFLYGPGATWAETPTAPDYWQHQGAGGRENWLDYDKLKARIEAALAAPH